MSRVDLTGAADLHLHFGPDPGRKRRVTGLEAVAQADAAGHRAMVLKSHDAPTAGIAAVLTELTPVDVFGSICCDTSIGGLNVEAVENALQIGGKIVWLPTLSSCQDWELRGRDHGVPWPGVPVCDEQGRLLPAAEEIVRLVHEHDAILATGHVSIVEHLAVAKAMPTGGKVIVTHALETKCGPAAEMTVDILTELVALGASIEFCALTCIGPLGSRPPQDIAVAIERLGVENCTIATDFGQEQNVPPAEGFGHFADALLDCGLSEADIRRMAVDNPQRLLGLQPA